MRVNVLARFVQWLLYITFAAGAVAFCAMPWLLGRVAELFGGYYFGFAKGSPLFLAFVMANCAGALWILGELIRMVRSVERGPFVMANVCSLKRMGVVAIAMSALFFARCFFFATILTVTCGAILLMCGLFSLVLSGVFRDAVRIKQENDLTI